VPNKPLKRPIKIESSVAENLGKIDISNLINYVEIATNFQNNQTQKVY
jgi:hypothetical protein